MQTPAALRLNHLRLVLLVLGFAQGFSSRIEANDDPRRASSTPPAAITNPRHAAFRLLHELDRFLDHHPLIENDLRIDPFVLESEVYLDKNPALRQFLVSNPEVNVVLKTEPRHLLHRALLREANVLLKWSEVAQLDAFLDQHPVIEQQLMREPALIHAPEFLAAEPQLRGFLTQNAALARGFLPTAPSS